MYAHRFAIAATLLLLLAPLTLDFGQAAPKNGTRPITWTSENDGHGSGLDADMLDGLHASDLLLPVENLSAIVEALEVALLGMLADLNASLAAEATLRQAGDRELANALARESATRAAAITHLTGLLQLLDARATALEGGLANEIAERQAADSALATLLGTHDHDGRYYTKSQSDGRYLQVLGKAYDADRLDGLDSAVFLRRDTSGTLTGTLATTGDVVVQGAVYASNWLRTYGSTGWYSETYGGGWFMQDTTWIRAYNNKNVYTGGEVQAGTLRSNGDIIANGHIYAHSSSHIGDIAEPTLAAPDVGAGDVVVMDGFTPEGKLKVRKADTAYSTGVVGVVSTNPSITLAGLATDTPLAVTGIVPVKVVGPVAAGDLLTSSATPGHAMRCDPATVSCGGVVLGKALEAFTGEGTGTVRAMVTLG